MAFLVRRDVIADANPIFHLVNPVHPVSKFACLRFRSTWLRLRRDTHRPSSVPQLEMFHPYRNGLLSVNVFGRCRTSVTSPSSSRTSTTSNRIFMGGFCNSRR